MRHDAGCCRRGRHAKHDASHLPFPGHSHFVHGKLQLRHERLRPRSEEFADDGETNLVGASLEQTDAQRLLKRLDLHAQRGLNDIELTRGTSEMESFGQNEEIAELADFGHGNHQN